MLNKLPFLNPVRTPCPSRSKFLCRIVFQINTSLTYQQWQKLRSLVIGAKKSQEVWIDMNNLAKKDSDVLCKQMASFFRITVKMCGAKQSSILNCWPVTSGQKNNNSTECCFPAGWSSSSRYRPRTFSFGWGVSKFMNWEVGFSRLGSKITQPSPQDFFLWDSWSSVLNFCAQPNTT